MKTIAISGMSGFVGTHLSQYLTQQGYQLIKITRNDLKNIDKLTAKIEKVEALINLAGANIIQRWTKSYKKVLYSSRIDSTQMLVKAMSKAQIPPKVFISTSAIGIYKNNRLYNETSTELENNFLANLCKDWETEAKKAEALNIRTVICRFGIILAKDGGALQKMLMPFKLGLGGVIGTGQQAVSFIHIHDLKRFYLHAIRHEEVEGIYNMTTPYPTTNKGLTKALGKVLNRPSILPLPTFVVKLALGQGSIVLTDGQSVLPKRVLESSFHFEFESINEVMEDLFLNSSG
ncbi:MAG: Cell division inhibitor [uncultured Sulfurovum sp.]|uniref:Cell division inhibitor n=1 Tax=uncultured Sulfurovum sp. TaxID=269237 RepID=A0A6S6T5C9_9BACT|nr:MAG: Cell division inhibitor [uncultured Sulfurovum sp.]